MSSKTSDPELIAQEQQRQAGRLRELKQTFADLLRLVERLDAEMEKVWFELGHKRTRR